GPCFHLQLHHHHQLAGLTPVAHPRSSFDDPPGNAEGEIDLVASAQMAGPDRGISDATLLHHNRADRTHHWCQLLFFFACSEWHDREDHRQREASEAEQGPVNGTHCFHEAPC